MKLCLSLFHMMFLLYILALLVYDISYVCDRSRDKNMGLPDSSQDLSTEMEVDAFRRIFPLRFFERHLSESLRPDARPLGKARDTIVNLG